MPTRCGCGRNTTLAGVCVFCYRNTKDEDEREEFSIEELEDELENLIDPEWLEEITNRGDYNEDNST